MIIFVSFLLLSLITTGSYVYFIEFLNGKILYYTIPLIYILSFIVLIILLILFLMICLTFRSFRKRKNQPSSFYTFFTTQVAEMITIIFRIKIIDENMDLLPKNQKFFLMSNHQSVFDPIAIIGYLKKHKISYIMKEELMKLPFVGTWLYSSGYLPIDRNNDRNALKTIITASKRLANKDPIGVYPEGTRSGSFNIQPFRNGIFKIAQKAKAPIVVCLIDNFYTVKKRFPWRRTKVLFKVCKVIPYEDIKDLHTNEIGEICRTVLIEGQKQAREKFKWIV